VFRIRVGKLNAVGTPVQDLRSKCVFFGEKNAKKHSWLLDPAMDARVDRGGWAGGLAHVQFFARSMEREVVCGTEKQCGIEIGKLRALRPHPKPSSLNPQPSVA
jgi:hypothetical protein